MKPVTLSILVLLASFLENATAQTPQWQWARSGVGEEYDQAGTVTTDASGNVIMAGSFSSDSIGFDGITLQNNTPGFSDLFIVKYGPTGNVMWSRAAGGNFDDKATSVATDAAGNVYLTGYFYSATINFGTYTLTNAGAVGDIFIVKYDPAGNVLWATREGAAGLEIPYSIVLDDVGNFIIAGRFSSNSVTFGSTTLAMAGSMDVFVVKYDPAGNVLWAQGAGGGSNDEAYALAVDATGDIIVAGYFTQEADFGTITLPNPGLANIFLAKCDAATGTFQWAKATAADGDERALGIALDALDNIYAVGFFQSDSLAFGTTTLYSTATDNGFIARYDNDGDPVWAQGLNGRSKVQGVVIVNGAVYACGTFRQDPMNYGPNSLPLAGGADLFVSKSDLAGNAQWAAKQSAGGESGELANAMAADVYGNLVVAGNFDSDDVTFGSALLTISDGVDAFVIRMGDPGVGIGEIISDDVVRVLPNPNAGSFTLDGLRDIQGLEIRDVRGALVHGATMGSGQGRIQVDMPEVDPGVYFIRVYTTAGPCVKKVVIETPISR